MDDYINTINSNLYRYHLSKKQEKLSRRKRKRYPLQDITEGLSCKKINQTNTKFMIIKYF